MFLKNFVAAAIVALLPVVAHAVTVEPEPRIVALEKGEDWTKFRFSPQLQNGAWLEGDVAVAHGTGPGVQRHELRSLIFEVTLQAAALLQVTDAWLYGDVFDVSWNGKTMTTSSVGTPDLSKSLSGNPAYDIMADYDAAFLDARWSSGSWLLGPGFYRITGKANPALMEGSAAIRVVDVPPVPAPASILLIMSASAAFGAASLFRRRTR